MNLDEFSERRPDIAVNPPPMAMVGPRLFCNTCGAHFDSWPEEKYRSGQFVDCWSVVIAAGQATSADWFVQYGPEVPYDLRLRETIGVEDGPDTHCFSGEAMCPVCAIDFFGHGYLLGFEDTTEDC